MQILTSRLRSLATLWICLCIIGHVNAADTDPDGRLYPPSVTPLDDVQRALDRAEGENRLLLVVLGANWCHDSRALAARLHREPLAEIIEQHYELVFVSAGFLDQGRDVMQQFDVAHYYATPTVLIIDPSSGRLINGEDRHQWGDAFRIDMPTTVEYFEKWPEHSSDAVTISAQLRELLLEIDNFEQQMAERVANGYAVIGPMLEAYEAGNAADDFDASWNELRDFRVAIPGDMKKLRDYVRRRVSAGDKDIQILFPTYPMLSWESLARENEL